MYGWLPTWPQAVVQGLQSWYSSVLSTHGLGLQFWLNKLYLGDMYCYYHWVPYIMGSNNCRGNASESDATLEWGQSGWTAQCGAWRPVHIENTFGMESKGANRALCWKTHALIPPSKNRTDVGLVLQRAGKLQNLFPPTP